MDRLAAEGVRSRNAFVTCSLCAPSRAAFLTGRYNHLNGINAAFGNRWLPMRCIRTRDRSYIWNAWSNGKHEYRTENMAGLTWKAMLAAAATDPAIKARMDFYLHRVPEEFYDLTGDPCERRNLIAAPARQPEIAAMRAELLALLRRTGDPLAEAFAHRDRPERLRDAMQKIKAECEGQPRNPDAEGDPGRSGAIQPAGDAGGRAPEP